MFRVSKRAVVLASVFAVVLSGCGGKKKGPLDKVVARAGDIQVTLSDFADAWNKISAPNRPDISTLEGKRTFANDLVNQRIILAEARRLGGITDPQIQGLLAQRRRQEMLSSLYRTEIEQKVDVGGAEVEDLYKRRGMDVKGSHILLDDEATARKVHDEITAGRMSFADAARKYTLDISTRENGGDLGQVAWSRTLPAFQERAFTQEPGTISEPFETAYGWHILRVDERVQKTQEPLETLRIALRNEVRRQKEQEVLRAFSADLEKKGGLAWNEAGVDTLLVLMDRMAAASPDTVNAEDRYLPSPTAEERAVVLATFSGRQWTIGDWVDGLARQLYTSRPQGRVARGALKELMRTTQIDQELAFQEAEAHKLGDDPAIASTVQRLEEQVLIEQLHSRFLQSVDITPEQVRAYFDSTAAADSGAVMFPERVDMLILINPSADVIRDALQRIRKGADEAEIAKEISYDDGTKNRGGRTGLIPRGTYSPPIEDIAFGGRVGKGWSEPIVLEGAGAAVKVLDQQPARRARFEEVEAQLTQNMQQSRGEQAFEDWLKKERETRNVEILDDVLQLYDQAVSPATAAPAGPAAPPKQG